MLTKKNFNYKLTVKELTFDKYNRANRLFGKLFWTVVLNSYISLFRVEDGYPEI